MPANTDESPVSLEELSAHLSTEIPNLDKVRVALGEVYREAVEGGQASDFHDFTRADLLKVVEYSNDTLPGLTGKPEAQLEESSRLHQNLNEVEMEAYTNLAEIDEARKYGDGPSEQIVDEQNNLNVEAATIRAQLHLFEAAFGK
ncbi:hypothetical protein A3F07_04460 [candidate division WWE3 bacterium RIFCSPHIGHO2_12_FULL_38_15]|uniref:Uncharacterized protein n=1 Tax=candidate division WWE3 bacterium RIFCSPHIGHO2_02_FULL_38_14 TaxID=1802620 RepID=A0A1F4VC25_UNCKA|nr:MAG: hypothetical protein A2793_01250 [candidate division WWE3 bacterium RIFCSPHIGHO2_01_FULL_38_45]OGC49003.1 MAG: hypothetical protein A3F07_04460 [candidate division WWE3 bacterium RIFCSPHIGHO2_12_FULL_38_15]OGC54614.1 MAG: hypothetical protein A3B64_03075 [candidate division WWE3 bacterium RIFCSPLOWO2_01_FULL_37_24]OGC54677.1 MAG: hypothetical protein A3D91_03650 [candidate division WWE3 bacterium RIFCSPHIGHO2_02_FULL_38_14]HLB51355.1 hypothetical protein [Patescibacteria group bacterium